MPTLDDVKQFISTAPITGTQARELDWLIRRRLEQAQASHARSFRRGDSVDLYDRHGQVMFRGGSFVLTLSKNVEFRGPNGQLWRTTPSLVRPGDAP